jgi:hypothetical protein
MVIPAQAGIHFQFTPIGFIERALINSLNKA